MEVALASPRTAEQYVYGLREGLKLTERMRALVEAIREVVDGQEENNSAQEQSNGKEEAEWVDCAAMLRGVMDELSPVAGAKGVRLALQGPEVSLSAKAGRQRLYSLMFRVAESALSLADRGSALSLETGGATKVAARIAGDEAWIRLRWYAGPGGEELSRAELGLLVAQAGWERAGAKWKRERAENLESLTIRLPPALFSIAASGGHF